MVFFKSFAKSLEGSSYPKWIEVALSDKEETEVEAECRAENLKIMKECIDDGRRIAQEKGCPDKFLAIAVKLFDKRASHEVYWKENKAKEKFDKL
ncbi:MAG TPA: hypothetical protein VJH97_04155 [Candidatus Nanoarchaeia archaeon]|nr:hypothetical protein [Candidatus Nanoarchaeia archaeon]